MIEGRKVILRGIRRADIQYFLKWLDDPEVSTPLGRYLPVSEIGEENWVREIERKKDVIVFTIVDKKTEKSIGNCGFHKIDFRNQRAELGIFIGEKEYWGKGYGTEALELLISYGFTQLNLHSIASLVVSSNERSVRLHKKLGFKEQGRMRQRVFLDNQFKDMIYFDMLKSEWFQRFSDFLIK
ncbi:GNAT family N-acetyltransferase [bacterium]|nr:GNAT family N-acetyltransferase [bacterium]